MKKVLTLICAILLALTPVLSACGLAEAENDEAKQAALQALCEEGLDYFLGINGKTFDREAAFRCFREAAEGGYAKAWFYMGEVLRSNSQKGAEGLKEAMTCYQKAEELGSLLGLYGQGLLEKDETRAKEIFEAAVAAGCVEANVGLASLCYDAGDGKGALRYLEKALEGEEVYLVGKAMNRLGLVYHDSRFGLRDYEKALEWYMKAVELGNGAAATNIGNLYMDGEGVEKDQKAAIAWYEKAAQMGDSGPLASCYYKGKGVARDYKKAMELYLKALDSTSVSAADNANDACFYIGMMYRDGLGVKQDYAASLEWFTRGSEEGDPDCTFALARQYMLGQGVEKDPARAEALMEAETKESGYACRLLGDMYRKGDLMEKNIEKAIFYYEKGCELGNRSCYARLGDQYALWQAGEKDYLKALEYYKKAAEMGYPYCAGQVGWIYAYQMNPPDYEKALSGFEMGAEDEDAYCLDRLGAFYEEGLGVAADPEKAAGYYYRAVVKAGKEDDLERQGYALEGLQHLKRTVERISINEKQVSLLIGASPEAASAQLSFTVTPEAAMWKDVVWTSSDEKIATVDKDGVVCAVAPGKVTISAATTQPQATAKAARINITVEQAVTGIETDSAAITIAVKKNAKVKASVIPENASNKKLAWSSENGEIAAVNAAGQITGKSAGTTTVTAKSTDGSEVSASIQVTVIQPVSRINIQDKNVALAPGASLQLTVQVLPENATDKTILWSSDQEAVATVDASGTVTAVGSGSCNITGTAADGSGIKAKIRVTVK